MKKILIMALCLMLVLPGCTPKTAAPATPTTVPVMAYVTEPTEPVTQPTELITEPTEPPLDFTDLDHDAIYTQIEEICKKYRAMGVQVAIVENGQVVGSYVYGWATYKKDPMTPAHKMRVASLSKVMIAIGAMRMYDDGIVDLYGSIGDVWGVEAVNPQFPDHPINIWNILSHTSSIASYEDDVPSTYHYVRNRLSYGYYSVEPGVMSSRCYNNYAFRVLGSTLELAAGKTLDTYLDETIYHPMQIDAAFAPGDLDDTSLVCTLYEGTLITRNVPKQLRYHGPQNPGENGAYFAGGLTISAEDLAKMAAMLGNDGVYNGQQYLKPETVALMEQLMEPVMANGLWQAHPLLFQSGMYGREQLYFHTGRALGVFTCFSYDAATGDGVVVLTTGAAGYMTDVEVPRICEEINQYLYDLMK